MAKLILIFNNTEYQIDDAVLDSATASLKSHLSTVMNGTGSTINLDGVAYNVDSTKLSTAMTDFISHLGTSAGNGAKVVVGGIEYSIDSTKVESATSWLDAAFDDLLEEKPDGNVIRLLSSDNLILKDVNGLYLIVKEYE